MKIETNETDYDTVNAETGTTTVPEVAIPMIVFDVIPTPGRKPSRWYVADVEP